MRFFGSKKHIPAGCYQEPSYKRHIGTISSNWELTGDYGKFLNHCRLEAWLYILQKYGIATSRVLDFGCATGSWSYNWRVLGFTSTVGLDVNPIAIEEAKSRLNEAFVGDSDYLMENFRDEMLIGCNGVLTHILEESEVEKLFQSFSYVLGGGGYLICAVLNPDYYVTPNGFKPWMGPNSCTRPLEYHKRAVKLAEMELVDVVGTFINPWFCKETLILAGDEKLKTDLRLFQVFSELARVLRDHGKIELFSEVLLVCKK